MVPIARSDVRVQARQLEREGVVRLEDPFRLAPAAQPIHPLKVGKLHGSSLALAVAGITPAARAGSKMAARDTGLRPETGVSQHPPPESRGRGPAHPHRCRAADRRASHTRDALITGMAHWHTCDLAPHLTLAFFDFGIRTAVCLCCPSVRTSNTVTVTVTVRERAREKGDGKGKRPIKRPARGPRAQPDSCCSM